MLKEYYIVLNPLSSATPLNKGRLPKKWDMKSGIHLLISAEIVGETDPKIVVFT